MGIILDELEANNCLCGVGLPDTENSNIFKNAIINGDFSVNQRGVTSLENGSGYIVDRVFAVANDSKLDVSVKNTIAGDGGGESTVSNPDPFGDSSGIVLYQFEDNADDTAKNYDGEWSGTEAYDDGKFGRCAKFDGSSYIDTNGIILPEDVFSISFFVKIIDCEGDNFLISQYLSDADDRFAIYAKDEEDFVIRVGSNTATLEDIFKDNQEWISIIVVKDVDKWKIYIDSELKMEWDNTDNINTDKNTMIGGTDEISDRNLRDGYIDQVRIFNRALTEDEVNALYNETYGSIVNKYDPFNDGSGIALYQFEEDTTDVSGNYNMDTSGDPTYSDGKFDKAINVDGDNHFISPDIDDVGAEFTISCWVYTSETDSGQIFQLGNDGDKPELMFGWGRFDYEANDGDQYDYTYDVPSPNEWHHIVLVVNIPNIKVYVDKELVKEVEDGNGSTFDHFDSFDNTNINQSFTLDQLRFFKKALSNDEIETLYNESVGRPIPINPYLQLTLNTKGDNAEIYPYIYKFEGQHISHLTKDDMTLSFDFMSSKSDTYNIKFKVYFTDGTNQEYTTTFEYNQNDCEDFCKVKVSIPKFDNTAIMDETLGAELYICNNLESQFSENDYIQITNIQLEVGESATSFEKVPKEIQLLRCKRYYRKGASDTYDSETDIFPMRTAPTITGDEAPYIYDAEL